ncbi:SDR family NAD(P)-dependent oxidoreductase [Nocardia panacis]|uniref:SDR family NAD(P)-dependent oxidoreductase n=1 Tax=Nocardia panacis TaxID=2340916 RepID=A0A3A4K1L5_9NOCA|nr:SDR family NAD(P)-dependent oxidoreductase [Nocardia panacis]RJO78308.1 SDR family NAD(P)-dependent oxidoreductase [Nocardia panacis]
MSDTPGVLAGRVAVVTGASRGIGKGIALELGAAGATVYLTGRTVKAKQLPGTVAGAAAEVDALGGVGVPVICDHLYSSGVVKLFERVREEQGRLDILVNNVYDSPGSARWLGRKFWEIPPAAWDAGFDIGVRSHYVAAFYAAPLLIEARGLIVNISSPGAVRTMHNAVYGVGKAALDRMTAEMAHDLADTATAVSLWPGIVNTELLQLIPPGPDGRRLLTIPGEPTIDLATAETPRFTGRAVVALAADPDRNTRTGKAWKVADLAEFYGFSDLPD